MKQLCVINLFILNDKYRQQMCDSLIIRFTWPASSKTESPRKSFYWSKRKWLNGCQTQPLLRTSRNKLDRHSSAFPIYVVSCHHDIVMPPIFSIGVFFFSCFFSSCQKWVILKGFPVMSSEVENQGDKLEYRTVSVTIVHSPL